MKLFKSISKTYIYCKKKKKKMYIPNFISIGYYRAKSRGNFVRLLETPDK